MKPLLKALNYKTKNRVLTGIVNDGEDLVVLIREKR